MLASIAPSYRHLPERGAVLVKTLRSMGFAAVEETVGALPKLVIMRLQEMDADPRPMFTSSCPVVVDLVRKDFRDLEAAMEPWPSPMVLHARSLKSRYGGDSLVVFIGPCPAKKKEARRFPGSVDLVLTFAEVWPLFRDVRGGPAELPVEFDNPPPRWTAGAVFRAGVSGLDECRRFLAAFPSGVDRDEVVELLACVGGCLNGPGMPNQPGRGRLS